MVQPVVNEMFATVHAAGSSLLGLCVYSLHVQPSIRDTRDRFAVCCLSESALSEGMPPIGPWRGVCVSACDIPGALLAPGLR
eukprot:scaffold8627_cov133-Isochrysis_galbana.AAC.2